MKLTLANLKKELKSKANAKRAKDLQRLFKTGPGEYGEGDVFIGLTVPAIRTLAKKYCELSVSDVGKLLSSKIHEERLAALLILVDQFRNSDESQRKDIFKFYLRHTRYINNWDLVDLSADKIVGAYLEDKPKAVLYRLVKSRGVWERRIAVLATFHFIKNDEFNDALRIAEALLNDEHDLIHKAVGWMLREVGKRSLSTEENFLGKYYKRMPRTMLRYAIEKFPEEIRLSYLKGDV